MCDHLANGESKDISGRFEATSPPNSRQRSDGSHEPWMTQMLHRFSNRFPTRAKFLQAYCNPFFENLWSSYFLKMGLFDETSDIRTAAGSVQSEFHGDIRKDGYLYLNRKAKNPVLNRKGLKRDFLGNG